jgi:3',5'-cyclic AMP phosphodiesterase CpdA
MRTVIHLSDLHFGRTDPLLIEPLISVIKSTQPHLIAISGDLTQRARTEEFAEARQFMEKLPFPVLVVPGNHDIPLHNLLARFARPFCKYRRYISDDLAPFFADSEIAVAGVNTARSLTGKYGRINRAQVAALSERFRPFSKGVTKVLVTHHPFDLPPGYEDRFQLVRRAAMAMKSLAKSGVDLLLAGHLHLTHTALTATRYRITGYSALVVQAGTAISTRGRGETNSFNILRIEPGKIAVERVFWNPDLREFRVAVTATFIRTDTGWQQREDSSPTAQTQSNRSSGSTS